MRKLNNKANRKNTERNTNTDESPQYKFFKDEIIKGYEINKIYDTGEISIFKNTNKTVKAVRRLIKFMYDMEKEQPVIMEYYVDAITKDSNLKTYNSIEIINKEIEKESSKIKTLEDIHYIPMDNLMIKTTELFKQKVDEIVDRGFVLGFRIMNLKWQITTALHHKLDIKNKIMDDHIMIHTVFSNKFFWDGVDVSMTDTDAEQFMFKPEWDEVSKSWKEGATAEEINKEFAKYFKGE